MRSVGGLGRIGAHLITFAALVAAAVGVPAQDLPDSEGRLLVVNQGADSLMVLDVPSHRLLATIPVGRQPGDVAALPDGSKAYVSNSGGNSISVVDLRTLKVVKTIGAAGLQTPRGLLTAQAGRWLLAASEGNRRLLLIDTRRDAVTLSVTTPQRAAQLAALEDGRTVYLVGRDSDRLGLVRLPDLKTERSIALGAVAEGVAVAPNGRVVVATLPAAGQVALYDTGSSQVLARLPAGQTPIRVAFAPRSFTALVVNRDSDDLTVLDVLSRSIDRTVRVGRRPSDVVTNARGTRAYVSNAESGNVSVFSLPGYEIRDPIPAGARPVALAFVPVPPGRGRRAGLETRPGRTR